MTPPAAPHGRAARPLEQFTPVLDHLAEPMTLIGSAPDTPDAWPLAVAVDAAGRQVLLAIVPALDAEALTAVLTAAGHAAHRSRDDTARIHPAGMRAYSRAVSTVVMDPDRAITAGDGALGVRVILVTSHVADGVQAAVDFLTADLEEFRVIPTRDVPGVTSDGVPQRRLGLRRRSARRSPYLERAVGGVAPVSSQAPAPVVAQPPQRRTATRDLGFVRGWLTEPSVVVWRDPATAAEYEAMLLPTGVLVLRGGQRFTSPTKAAMAASGRLDVGDGWEAWRLGSTEGETLAALHKSRGRRTAQ